MTYKITSGGSKEKIQHGQFVKLHIEYKLKSKDTTLQTTYGHIPYYIPIDTNSLGQHTFTEIITQLGSGDKVNFTIFIDTLKKMQLMEYNDMFKQGDQINGRAEILKVFTNQDSVKADYDKEVEQEKARNIAFVKEYAKSKNLKTQASPGGVEVHITQEGEGPLADSGKQVFVRYRGYLIEKGKNDGKEFDSNMNPLGANNQPISVIVGTGGVIPGWDEALKMLKKGSKATIFIPAMMGYGPQGSPPVIPPFANIGFDIEVLDIVVPQPQKPGAAPNPVDSHEGHNH